MQTRIEEAIDAVKLAAERLGQARELERRKLWGSRDIQALAAAEWLEKALRSIWRSVAGREQGKAQGDAADG